MTLLVNIEDDFNSQQIVVTVNFAAKFAKQGCGGHRMATNLVSGAIRPAASDRPHV